MKFGIAIVCALVAGPLCCQPVVRNRINCSVAAANPGVCQVIEIVNPDSASHTAAVSIPALGVPGIVKNVSIVWRLPEHCRFFGNDHGDGVFLKPNSPSDGEFSGQVATDDEHNHPSPKDQSRRFHWKDKNSRQNAYEYMILFHCRLPNGNLDRVQYKVDPFIANDG